MDVYIDLDGTLTDPFEGISKCICDALERLGESMPSEEDLRRFIGPPLLDTFGELIGAERAPEALEYYRERFDEIGWRENVPYEGIHDSLDAITRAGHRCYVATTKPHVFARRIVEHFGMGQYFVEIYGSELDGTRTDKTELLAWARNGSAAESVMIGDRYHDIVGARNNAFHAIGVTWGYGSPEELLDAGAHVLAAAPDELVGLLELGERTSGTVDDRNHQRDRHDTQYPVDPAAGVNAETQNDGK
jgi:phosphoglycolate phosphatase